MEIQRRGNDLQCIENAFRILSSGNGKTEHRSLLIKDVVGSGGKKKFMNLELKKWERINDTINIKIINGNNNTNQKFNTITIPERQDRGSKEPRNPYQNKINYFHAAMRNSKINSALGSKKENKKKNK